MASSEDNAVAYTMTGGNFAGEEYLLEKLPEFEWEWQLIIFELVLTGLVCIVILPIAVSALCGYYEKVGDKAVFVHGKLAGSDKPPVSVSTTKTITTTTSTRVRRGRKGSKSTTTTVASDRKAVAKKDNGAEANKKLDMDEEAQYKMVVPVHVMILVNVLLLLLCVFVILSSPNNKQVARGIFVAPLLSPEDCRRLIGMANSTAERNVQQGEAQRIELEISGQEQQDPFVENMLNVQPRGWRKDRHTSYPTTDLNWITDPFTDEDREWLAKTLNARLAPLIERTYGVNANSIRATDMFVVRYDGDGTGQASLRKHTDSSHVSFNVLLNDEFEGGGTRYHNRRTREYMDAKPHVGEVLLNNAMVEHEGLPTISGTRYILVGFLSVDDVNPFNHQRTGLSIFASWLCLPWIQVRFKDGLHASLFRKQKFMEQSYDDSNHQGDMRRPWVDNKYVRGLFDDIRVATTVFGDWWSPHFIRRLVDPSQAPPYLQALDAAYSSSSRKKNALWFSGQQVDVDFDGQIARLWTTREAAGENVFGAREL